MPVHALSLSPTTLAAAVVALLALPGPTPVSGQTLADLREALEQGGGWVPIEVRNGRATLETAPIPTGGLLVQGYFQVWDENSGTWRITASDPLNQAPGEEPILDVEARAGERVPFSRRAGLVSRLTVDVRWSEPGDTTLWLWVGLGEDPPPPTVRGPGS